MFKIKTMPWVKETPMMIIINVYRNAAISKDTCNVFKQKVVSDQFSFNHNI